MKLFSLELRDRKKIYKNLSPLIFLISPHAPICYVSYTAHLLGTGATDKFIAVYLYRGCVAHRALQNRAMKYMANDYTIMFLNTIAICGSWQTMQGWNTGPYIPPVDSVLLHHYLSMSITLISRCYCIDHLYGEWRAT